MPLESGTYVSDLVATNPAGSDEKKFGDDHLRLIKSCVKATLPDGDHKIRDVRAIAISADTTVTVGAHDDAYLSVDTSTATITLTVDDSASRAWVFFYKQTAGSNGITIKRQSDSATMSTLASGLVIVNGTDISVITEPPDGSITPAKIDSSQDYTFGIVYGDAFVSAKNASNANEGGRVALEPPTSAVTLDTASKWNAMVGIYTDGSSEDFFKFPWKDSSGTWRSYKLPLNTGGYVWADDNFAARIAALTANASPTGTESVACDDGQRVTIKDIAGFAFANPDFTSGALSIDTSTTGIITVAHGLGSTPSFVIGKVVCNTAELGYSVGDVFWFIYTYAYVSANKGYHVTADATNIYFADGMNGFYVVDKSTATMSGITSANWDLYLLAWR